MSDQVNIAVVGATGAVGQEFLKILPHRNLPLGIIRVFASKRSAGTLLPFGESELQVEVVTPESFRDIDIVFISVSADISREIAPLALDAGSLVIDDSSAFRLRDDVPLVIPEVNGDQVEHHAGIISIPNCSTIQLVMAINPIHKVNPIKRIVVDTYQAVSGAGKSAVAELHNQTTDVSKGVNVNPNVFPHKIGFNLIPHIGDILSTGYTDEEEKMTNETKKILRDNSIGISATCVRVPVYRGHSEAVHIEMAQPMDVSDAKNILSMAPGVKVVDDSSEADYPMPLYAEGEDDVFVGRIRKDWSSPNGLAFWVVSDNLRKGAALNAIQIAEEVIRRQ